MKKRLALIMTVILSILTLSACSETQDELYSKLKQSNAWEASEVSLKGNITVSAPGEESVDMGITATGYSNIKDKQSFFEYTVSDSSNTVDIPNIKMFMNDTDSYINKEYFTSMISSSKLEALDAEYICMTQDNALLKELIAKSYDAEFMYSLYEKMIGKLGVDIPVVKNGNAYTISMNGEQFIDEILKAYDKFVTEIDSFNTEFNLEFTQDEINNIKSSYNKENLEIYIATFKAMIKDSTIDLTYDFKDDSTVDMGMNFDMPILIPLNEVENMSIIIKMNLSGQMNKAEVKAVEMPSNSVKFTQQELMDLMMTDYQ